MEQQPSRPLRDAAVYRRRLAGLLAAFTVAICLMPIGATPAFGAELTMTAEAMLGGHVRPGAWTGIRVSLANDGPPIAGEVRLAGRAAGRSSYGVAVDMPTGARKDYTLYAHSPILGGKLEVALIVDGQTRLTSAMQVTGHDPSQPIVVIVAERPEAWLPDVAGAVRNLNPMNPTNPALVTLAPNALPRRVEAWSAIDRLIWQDIDSAQLDADQLASLETWVAAGGQLVIAGGTTGIATLAAFPEALLPYRPRGTVDVEASQLTDMLGTLPAGAAKLPALEGTLLRGTVLARSGDGVVAAQAPIGSGSVTLIGFDPGTSWLKGTAAATTFWRRALPPSGTGGVNPLLLPDDSQIVNALQQLPAVELPPIDQLFLLLLGYIALVGPVNYLVLRRLDRREWAWITMPVLVALFAAAAYTLGAGLKGSDVVINEVAIVRAAQGTERGLGQVYIGIFSPARAKYDVKVGGGALLSNPISQLLPGAVEQPLDVLFGDPSRLRDYQVGFGQLRGFRAETAVTTPRMESDLHLDGGRLKGTVTNRSEMELQATAVVFGSGVAILGTMPPGSSQTIDVSVSDATAFEMPLSERLFGSSFTADPNMARVLFTRRSVIDQLTQYAMKSGGTGGLGDVPMLIAWDAHPALDVDVGDSKVTRVGETMFLTPLKAKTTGRAVFGSDLMRRTTIASDAGQAFDQGFSFELSRGTMTIEYRPAGFEGRMVPDTLRLHMSQGEPFPAGGAPLAVDPLPAVEQPSQDDPTGTGTADPVAEGAPAFQLYDRVDGRWLEFAHVPFGSGVTINRPERYVDASGSLLVRFVNRAQQSYFQLFVRIEGAVP
ncbi:MAG: hypothetical protein H0W07_06960 [Chloroflexi bacterium]|nr:hypothetical protein [Chloroflexota bacterium]